MTGLLNGQDNLNDLRMIQQIVNRTSDNNGLKSAAFTTADQPQIQNQADSADADNFEAPFLPHSPNTVFGVDNTEQYWEHYVQNNFHARVLRHLSPDLLHFPVLDNYMGEFIKRRVCMGIELQELDQ